MPNTCRLTLSEDQCYVMVRALDLLARVGMGHLDHVIEELDWHPAYQAALRGADDSYKLRNAMRALMDAVHVAVSSLPASSYHSIHSPKLDDSARVAWDIHQVIRHALAQAGYGPHRTSTTCALPRIEALDTGD